jgi:acetoin utilization protein AcuB
MFVTQSMTKNVVTIEKSADIIEAVRKMKRHGFRHLPVIEADHRLIGIVTDRDLRSALPSSQIADIRDGGEQTGLSGIKIKDIMTPDPTTVSLSDTIQDALLMLQEKKVGALPVVDEQNVLKGIVSVRDLLRAFVHVLGIEEPGTLLCIMVEEKIGQLKKIVDAITEENISFGSVLVSRHGEENKRAVFPYLLTQNIGPIKKKLKDMGFTLLDPMDWHIDQQS